MRLIDFDAEFEAKLSLLIEDLTAMAATPGSLDERILADRKFLLERASYSFRRFLVSTKRYHI